MPKDTPKEQPELKATKRVPQGGEIREVMTQRGLVEMIPVSALLTDEAIEAMVKALERPYEWARQSKEEFTKDALQAAIEHVGGGQGGR